MERKKSKKADLENKRFIFKEIGLIIALSLVLLAFEWKSYDKTNFEQLERQIENIPEEIIPITEQKIQTPPPPINQFVQINIVDDDIQVDDDIDINVEADEKTVIEEYIPTPTPIIEEEEQQEEIFMIVESMPEFPGGESKLYEYLADNIKYPELAKDAGISGRVFVSFVVEKDGSVTDIRILRGIGGGCDEEAIRLVKNMPKWTPGKQRGKAVRVTFNLSIKFTLLS